MTNRQTTRTRKRFMLVSVLSWHVLLRLTFLAVTGVDYARLSGGKERERGQIRGWRGQSFGLDSYWSTVRVGCRSVRLQRKLATKATMLTLLIESRICDCAWGILRSTRRGETNGKNDLAPTNNPRTKRSSHGRAKASSFLAVRDLNSRFPRCVAQIFYRCCYTRHIKKSIFLTNCH